MNGTRATEGERRQALWPLVADDGIDKAMNSLIPQAQALIQKLFRNQHRMERHQFTNLVTTTLETESVPVVLDYIRYQIGRDTSKNTWRVGDPGFGEELLEQLEELRSRARGLIDNGIREYSIEPEDREGEEARLWMMLVRRYAGSLHHHFVYFKEG